jgi:hypothetical protein
MAVLHIEVSDNHKVLAGLLKRKCDGFFFLIGRVLCLIESEEVQEAVNIKCLIIWMTKDWVLLHGIDSGH